jgi:ATP/maltotriose-dependent transcriptional regulator MalT
LALKIFIIKNDRVVFKHELYRRTIEGSLSPFKRVALNKMMLDLFLASFEEAGDIERIVHYAKNANEYELVIKYASMAAKQAASVGAHTEAAKLYLTAIEYYQGDDEGLMLQFYEGYAFECYLTNRLKEAIIYTTKSLNFLEKGGDPEKHAKCLCFLSWLCWIDDDLQKAEDFALHAIDVLKDKPVSHSKATAYSLLSQLKMMADLSDECIFWGEQAIAMAEDLGDKGLLSYALGNVGSVKIRIPAWQQEGLSMLQQSLEIGLQHSYHDYTGMAYINLAYNNVIIKDFPSAKKALNTGIDYCEENNLYLVRNYLLIVRARLHLETGDWTAAYNIAMQLADEDKQLKVINIYALSILASIEMRRGNATDILSRLTKATSYAFETKEPQRIVTALSAFLEYEWIMGKHFIDDELLKSSIEIMQTRGNIYRNSEFHFWLQKARGQSLRMTEVFQGYEISDLAKAKKAASLWKNTGCPYNEALALSKGTEDSKREAIVLLQGVGADAVVQKIKAEMRSSGIKSIPRGMRKSTLSNAALLTSRELDILQLLKEGLQNKEIAGKLFIAPKTVDHHISAILFKLDVSSRVKAVNEAVRQEIIK